MSAPSIDESIESRPMRAQSPSDLILVDQHEAQGWRVRQDERLDHLFEQRCDWVRKYGRPGQLAVDAGEKSLRYDELDGWANRMARYLRLRGAGSGDRIALLFDDAADAYVAMLAVLKIGATYVPLDAGYPMGRMAYMVEDAKVRTVLSVSHLAERIEQIELLTTSGAELVYIDQAMPLIAEMADRRLIPAERGSAADKLAYITYTQGASGRLTGVAVDHRSICNFVKVAAEIYGIKGTDRVYQGRTIASDFSVEEIWVPWVQGATLVPAPPRARPRGAELHRFLDERRVTALCTVPRLLDTIPADLPHLRFLLVSEEPCPAHLVERWHRAGRRFLNVYGPPEVTVTAIWTELHPSKPASIGVPLPTYSAVILDVDDPYRALPHGQVGEIAIAGIGLARGYLNRDDLTREAFIPDFLGIPGNPSGRIYRTGDLGRINADGEIEYHGPVGRAAVSDVVSGGDGAELPTQMLPTAAPTMALALPAAPAEAPTGPATGAAKAMAEVLAEVLGVEQVSVDGNFFDDLGADSMVMARFCAKARKQPDLPSVSMKDIYRNTTIRALATALADPASTSTERGFAEVLAQVLGVEQVSVDGNFFDDLGADSMVMARFCAKARKRLDLPSVSMKDIYRYSTVRALATGLGEPAPASGTAAAVLPEAAPAIPPSAEVARFAAGLERRPAPSGKPRYVLSGALQLLFFLGYCCLAAVLTVRGAEWISTAPGELDIYLRSVAVGAAAFLGLCTLPVVAKWLIIGRWKPQEFRVWSLPYVGFWLVKTLIRLSPLARMGGSPLYVLYLRALGAKIGRGVTILSDHAPVCTDLLTIGEGTVIRKDSFFNCYRARAGVIEVGPVTLGRDVYVGEATVLDIGTSIGDGAQLGNSSALHAGQAVPAGERWHGSPAQRTDTDYRLVPPARVGTARRTLFALGQLASTLLVFLPLTIGGLYLLLGAVPRVRTLLGDAPLEFTGWAFYVDTIVASLLLFLGGVIGGLLFVFTVPRLLGLFITPDKVYPLYGFHYWAQRTITRTTNRKFFTNLFGDSSYIVDYLRSLGLGLRDVEQTGSNFGMSVKQDNPYLSSVGSGTVIADGLSIINADFSNTSFRVSRVSIGAHNFLGNRIAYPAQGRTGDNCLLATKVMVPIDGPVREGVGLLGSPSFEIPRSVARDSNLDLGSAEELRLRLAAKNRHNLVSMVMRLTALWLHVFMVTLFTLAAMDLYHSLGVLAFAASNALAVLFSAVYFVLVDRAVRNLEVLRPNGCSIYDPDFWRHERAWKVVSDTFMNIFNGTPFKNIIWRAMGAKVGRRLFDDGAFLTERTFTTIGDDCTLNEGSVIQCHSQEDGAFKSDRSALGAGCTLGVGAFVHYGVTMGDGAELAADSFLMKGEEIPPGEYWGGNPARELISLSPAKTN